MQPHTKSTLSHPRAHLIKLMQCLDFGSIENIVVRDGEPVFNPPPRVVRDVKFGGENGPRPESSLNDFVLKASVRDFLARLDAIGDGTIRCLDVKHGLPFRMQVEEMAA